MANEYYSNYAGYATMALQDAEIYIKRQQNILIVTLVTL